MLAAAGTDTFGNSLGGAELFAPSTGAWTSTGSLATARQYPTATLLSTGQVLIVGGYDPGSSTYPTSTELY